MAETEGDLLITLRWNTFDDAAPDSFNVYRSFVGLTIDFPNDLAVGDKLIFAVTSETRQTITLARTTIAQVVEDINAQAHGLVATKNTANTKLFLRATASVNPKLKLYPCAFLTNTDQAVRLIGPKSEFSLVGNVPFVAGTSEYSFEDADGDSLDFYHLTTVTGSDESIPSIDLQPIVIPAEVCTVEGRVIDGQNRPIVSVVVKATVVIPVGMEQNSSIIPTPVQILTDSLGRWSLSFIRCQLVLFQIEAVGYNQVVSIPNLSAALFRDLKPVDDYVFDRDREL